MKTKRIYLDLETTGTIPLIHGVHQIAGVFEIDGKMVEEFNYSVKPFDHREIDEEALKVSGQNRSSIMSHQDPINVFKHFWSLICKIEREYHPNMRFTLAGYKIDFDIDFLAKWFLHNNALPQMSVFQNWMPVDVLALARQMREWGDKDLCKLSNFRLATLCSYFSIPHTPHHALSDAKAARELHKQLTVKLVKQIRGK